jgi:tRNA G10  N-methylase Trm11
MKLLFELGHQPHISIEEIRAVFDILGKSIEVEESDKSWMVLELSGDVEAWTLTKRLGGTISVAEHLQDTATSESVADYLEKTTEGKIHFSVRGHVHKKFGLEVKKELKKRGRSVRFVEPKNTATILHNNLVEKEADIVVYDNKTYVTRGIQPMEDFSKRDYGKPGVDSKSGMLPPKLARTMVNLAAVKDGKLLDPFCGSGVLLMEGALMGYEVFGSDISEKAVEDTRTNLDWLYGRNTIEKTPNRLNIHLLDARRLTDKFDDKSVDLIAAEPYMGKPLHGNESDAYLKKQTDELASLYIESFKQFKRILRVDAPVIFIIPRFKYKEEWITVDCVSQIEDLGFKQLRAPLLYHRKSQHVGREIFSFTKE